MAARRIIRELRFAAVVWLRLMLAVQIVVLVPGLLTAPLGGLAFAALMTPPALLVAAPVGLMARWALRREAPFLRPAYLAIMLYGPIALTIAAGVPGSGVGLVFAAMAYEAAALVVAAVYVLLWRLGDRLLGDAERPRTGRRWIFAAVLAVLAVTWVPYAVWSSHRDDCADRGGRASGFFGCD